VAVVGCGAVGLCAVVAAGDLGATEVIAVEPERARRDAAVRVGATSAVAPDDADYLGPFDAVVEAAGPMAAQALAARLAGIGATIAIAAVQTADRFGIDPVLAYDRNLTVRAGRAPVRSILADLLPRVVAGEVELPTDAIVTERGVDLADGPQAYERFAAREDGLVKLAFNP
jgi:threonine dehydrogenase-like Zn-dependent dehydrogenase